MNYEVSGLTAKELSEIPTISEEDQKILVVGPTLEEIERIRKIQQRTMMLIRKKKNEKLNETAT